MTEDQTAKPREKCQVWTGSIAPNGYGKLYLNGKNHNVHRLAWAIANGRSPRRGMDICHHCDNRSCIEPSHLFEGTRADNMKDAVNKNRIFNPNTVKTNCSKGHAFDEDNTRIRPSGRRECKLCRKIFNTRSYRRSRMAVK